MTWSPMSVPCRDKEVGKDMKKPKRDSLNVPCLLKPRTRRLTGQRTSCSSREWWLIFAKEELFLRRRFEFIDPMICTNVQIMILFKSILCFMWLSGVSKSQLISNKLLYLRISYEWDIIRRTLAIAENSSTDRSWYSSFLPKSVLLLWRVTTKWNCMPYSARKKCRQNTLDCYSRYGHQGKLLQLPPGEREGDSICYACRSRGGKISVRRSTECT